MAPSLLAVALILSAAACHHAAFADISRCSEDLREYEDRVRVERDTAKEARLIARADSDAIRAGRGELQRAAIHTVLTFSARSGLVQRGARTGTIAQFICAARPQ